jgi:adsorption protein B
MGRNPHLVIRIIVHSVWIYAFGALAICLLLGGLDDLIPLAILIGHHVRRWARGQPEAKDQTDHPESRIAIFVPCWKESLVIGNMVRHNLTAIRYRNFDIFLGAYPNDEPTVAVANQLSETFSKVHAAVCPSPGPTSKADCLNSIYEGMLLFERQHNVHFTTVVLHDAEDLIHPEALSLINRERASYDMVQVPVLPLPTPFHELTHGVYCDEFAEFQNIDMHARQFSGSFVPSNGVGTGFAREILERLACERGQVFDAESLTEDYEIGVYIHDKGYRQLFAPIKRGENGFVATREYFPRTTRTAIRQRSRWVTGIALQCWERRGWRGSLRTRYWFWRDRKGLVANPLSLLTNFLFLAGLTDLGLSILQHRPWALAVDNPRLAMLCWFTMSLQCLRLGLRMLCVGRIFGPVFALGVPLRSFLANLINCFASLRATWRYFKARRSKLKLVWLKTEHAYPIHSNLAEHRRDFCEIVINCGFVSRETLMAAKQSLPAGSDLGEYLLGQSLISDENLCRALSLFTGVPIGRFDASAVKKGVRRTLPAHVTRRFGIVPVDIRAGRLIVAGRQVPTPDELEAIKTFTSLAVDFQLTTQENYFELQKQL